MKRVIVFDFCGTLLPHQTLRTVLLYGVFGRDIVVFFDKFKVGRAGMRRIERLLLLIMPYFLIDKSINSLKSKFQESLDISLLETAINEGNDVYIVSASSFEIINAVLEDLVPVGNIIAARLNQSILGRYRDFIVLPCRRKGKVIWWHNNFHNCSPVMQEFHTDSHEDDSIGLLSEKYIKISVSERFYEKS
jgi:hypothetical protein